MTDDPWPRHDPKNLLNADNAGIFGLFDRAEIDLVASFVP
jgi:hypothetical protein